MKKASEYRYLEALKLSNGRGDRIRTYDPLVPNQMRYQTALRPEPTILPAHQQLFCWYAICCMGHGQ